MRLATILVAVGLALAVAAPASAQDATAEAEARSVFDAGQVAFTAGHYADALVYFRRSYDLSHRPALLFNIALCHDRLRSDDAAIEAYDRYLAAYSAHRDQRDRVIVITETGHGDQSRSEATMVCPGFVSVWRSLPASFGLAPWA